jgi:hypothetical protein
LFGILDWYYSNKYMEEREEKLNILLPSLPLSVSTYVARANHPGIKYRVLALAEAG